MSVNFKLLKRRAERQRLQSGLRCGLSIALWPVYPGVLRSVNGRPCRNAVLGVRLHYDIRRELTPYVGISFDKSFGETASLVRGDGGDPSQIRFAVGVQAWF